MASRIADFHIRRSLHANQLGLHRGEPNTLVLDEFGLCQGTARVDVAVINGQLNGYEIKSDRDTLERLPGQVEIYNRVLDTIVLVTGARHVNHVTKVIADWWGIIVAKGTHTEVAFEIVREPELNTQCNAYAVAQLLWRDEALVILEEHKLHRGLKSRPRQVLWQVLAEELPLVRFKEAVRTALKARQNWRENGLAGQRKLSSPEFSYVG
jgi:hypothetical protein